MKNKLLLEITWWVFTVVLAMLVILPIYINTGDDYPFYLENILCIIIAITFIRYIFLLKHHFFTISKVLKIIFIFVPIPVFIFLIDTIGDFQAFVDEIGLYSIMPDVPLKFQKGLGAYIQSEMIFFWVAAFLANLLMPVRMIISIWREINKGTH